MLAENFSPRAGTAAPNLTFILVFYPVTTLNASDRHRRFGPGDCGDCGDCDDCGDRRQARYRACAASLSSCTAFISARSVLRNWNSGASTIAASVSIIVRRLCSSCSSAPRRRSRSVRHRTADDGEGIAGEISGVPVDCTGGMHDGNARRRRAPIGVKRRIGAAYHDARRGAAMLCGLAD